MSSGKLHASFLVSIADLFIGAAGIIICLIVLASSAEDYQAPRGFDRIMRCAMKPDDGLWRIHDVDTDSQTAKTVSQWLGSLEPTALLVRVGLEATIDQMGCFKSLRMLADDRNLRLTSRDIVGVSVAVVLLPLVLPTEAEEHPDEQ